MSPAVFICLFLCTSIWSAYSIETYSIEKSDTLFFNYPQEQTFFIPQKHNYHQTLTMKLFMSQAHYDEVHKRKDNGISEVFLTCEQSLDIIRRMDNLTLGIPKIVYLVGWQYNGHDSKYPAWFEGNEKLKRPGDKNALESLKWLMHEASKYNTTVSLHINMFDAYEDSPLWDTYVENNIIARNADGSLRACEWGYPISYAREWETGFAQNRIDSLCSLLPIQKSGTIHIDAFHTWPPVPVFSGDGNFRIDLTRSVTSPYLPYSIENETEAQREIFRYWASKGIDVTSESVDFLRETAFEGYQAMSWWFNGLDNYLRWPASYYSGGRDNSLWGRLFGTSMHGEDIVRKDPVTLEGFAWQFAARTAVWYFLNRLDRQYLVNTRDYKSVQFSNDVRTILSGNHFTVTMGDRLLVENENVFIPALWMEKQPILAYSKEGYQNKQWNLPEDWINEKKVKLSMVTDTGLKEIGTANVHKGEIILSLEKDQTILIEKISF
jgi:hypothetical protein